MINMNGAKSDHFSGIDACKGGWLGVDITDDNGSYLFETDLSKLINRLSDSVRILVDMPIGLLSKEMNDFSNRPCDAVARKMLGKKHSSIFSPPFIEALFEKNYADAGRINFEISGKKISKQSWNIVPKIREVNSFLHLHREWRGKILESHPELTFKSLNHNKPLLHSKKKKEGIIERIYILEKHYPAAGNLFERFLKDNSVMSNANKDDMADALCLAVLNYTRGNNLQNISDKYPEDSLGNRMGIWL